MDDLADACVFLMQQYGDRSHVNVGTGEDVSIAELASLVRDVVHPGAALEFDTTEPDGAPRKLLDVSRIRGLGWAHRTALREGVRATYEWFLGHRPVGATA